MMFDRRRLLARASRLGLALPLAACTPLAFTGGATPTLYSLTPKTTFADDLPDLNRRILVEPPTAASGLNTARIALKPELTLLEYYANAQWVEVVPIMVQTLTRESLDASGTLDVLGPESTGLRPDYVLRIHIREFQAEYDNGIDQPPLANVRLQVRLLSMPRRESLNTTSAQQLVRADSTSLDAVVLAYDAALGNVLKNLVRWVIEEITKAEDLA